MTAAKQSAYTQLVAARKACTRCLSVDFLNPGCGDLSQWDSQHIGPWSRWLGDLNARVLIVGQDWGDTAAYLKQKGIDAPWSATNQRLRELLALVGINVPDASDGAASSSVFLTNAALCLKRGGCQAPVRASWFKNCGSAFLRPLIEIVRPKVVVGLGVRAYHAVVDAYGIRRRPFVDVVDGHPVALADDVVLVPVYHCGRRIRNTHRSDAQQEVDWQRVRSALADTSELA